ncbi:hypothetical protein CEXT_644471 [Caerostris extrusa]|uniref:Uncharacterized protein n=1 Tax=Caerostris extrusa TaxID=172846 RepID=A0AAV4XJE0_CAEEX|nr:hypothetical protein CEXT_644471 [Caerostris extrusa]
MGKNMTVERQTKPNPKDSVDLHSTMGSRVRYFEALDVGPFGHQTTRVRKHFDISALKDTLHAQHAIRCDLSGNTIHSKTRLWEKRHDGSGQGSPERRGLCTPLLKYPNNGRRGEKRVSNEKYDESISQARLQSGNFTHGRTRASLPLRGVRDPVSLSVRCLGDASSPLCIQRASAKLDIYLISRL